MGSWELRVSYGGDALGVNNSYYSIAPLFRCVHPEGIRIPLVSLPGCLYVCLRIPSEHMPAFFIEACNPQLDGYTAFVEVSTLFRSFRLRPSSSVYVDFTTPSPDTSRYPVTLANSSNFWRGSGMKRNVDGHFLETLTLPLVMSLLSFSISKLPHFFLFICLQIELLLRVS